MIFVQKIVFIILNQKSKKQKNRIFILKKNNGVGGATLKGFKIASNQGYDILLKFDSDNQHKVKDLSRIIKLLQNNHVLFCKGYRDLRLINALKENAFN